MRRTSKSMFVLVLATAAAAPSAASAATPIPPLSAGDTQAYAALTAGGARITAPITRAFTGSMTWNGSGGFQETCANMRWDITISTAGTTQVTNATFANCTTNVPGCSISVTATDLPWGNRLVRDSAGIFRDRINVRFTRTLVGTCPWPAGPYLYTGTLSPRLNGGTPATAVFDTNSGSVTTNTGPATMSGTLTGGAGQATHFRL